MAKATTKAPDVKTISLGDLEGAEGAFLGLELGERVKVTANRNVATVQTLQKIMERNGVRSVDRTGVSTDTEVSCEGVSITG